MFDESKPVTTIAEAKAFAIHLFFGLSVAFHPDDDFNDYVYNGREAPIPSKRAISGEFIPAKRAKAFAAERAELLNKRMSECREVCAAAGVDVCEAMDIQGAYFAAVAQGLCAEEAGKAAQSTFNGRNHAEAIS